MPFHQKTIRLCLACVLCCFQTGTIADLHSYLNRKIFKIKHYFFCAIKKIAGVYPAILIGVQSLQVDCDHFVYFRQAVGRKLNPFIGIVAQAV